MYLDRRDFSYEAIAIALMLNLSVYVTYGYCGANIGNFDGSNWMSKLPTEIKEKPLKKIAIPGTHDSFALWQEMDLNNNFTPDEYTKEEQFVMSHFRKEVKDWSAAQNLSAINQLRLGIRYFDLRVAYTYPNKTGPLHFYAAHGLITGAVLPKLREINYFLESKPEEIVILDFQALFNMTIDVQKTLAREILEIFGTKIISCNSADPLEVKLSELHAAKQQVLVLFNEPIQDRLFSSFCNRTIISNPWADTTNIGHLMKFITVHFNERDQNLYYVVQGMLTPGLTSVWSCVTGKCVTLETYAERTNPLIVQWLSNKTDVNIVLTNYSQLGNIVPTVIKKNYKNGEL